MRERAEKAALLFFLSPFSVDAAILKFIFVWKKNMDQGTEGFVLFWGAMGRS